jgi:hypothetical protein
VKIPEKNLSLLVLFCKDFLIILPVIAKDVWNITASSEGEDDEVPMDVTEGPDTHVTRIEMSPEFIRPLIPETKVPEGDIARSVYILM